MFWPRGFYRKIKSYDTIKNEKEIKLCKEILHEYDLIFNSKKLTREQIESLTFDEKLWYKKLYKYHGWYEELALFELNKKKSNSDLLPFLEDSFVEKIYNPGFDDFKKNVDETLDSLRVFEGKD